MRRGSEGFKFLGKSRFTNGRPFSAGGFTSREHAAPTAGSRKMRKKGTGTTRFQLNLEGPVFSAFTGTRIQGFPLRPNMSFISTRLLQIPLQLFARC